MSPIEKHLADLLEKSPDKLPLLLEETSLTQKEMQLLAAQGLVQKHDRPDGGWWVNPTDDGLLYFIRKKRKPSCRPVENACFLRLRRRFRSDC